MACPLPYSTAMTATMLRSRTTVVLLTFFLAVISVDAQPRQGLSSKLDAKLAEKVGSGAPGTTRVIIRTSSDGVPRLTNALKAKGRRIDKVHLVINALTAEVPIEELEEVSALPFVESISTDAIVK